MKKLIILILAIIIILILTIIIIGISCVHFNYNSFQKDVIVKDDVLIEIKPGDNLKTLSSKLILNYFFLKKYINENNPGFELQVGSYEIKKDSSIERVIDSLEKPLIDEVDITILEGWNIYDIDYTLSKNSFINKGEYIKYVTNIGKIKDLSEFFVFIKSVETLEGFLYPDTYRVNREKFKINSFVIKQLDTFEKKVYNTILKPVNLTKQQIVNVVNLASIVEKEERNPKEKATIAGILKKRFREDWFIGADITVCYPHKLTSQECKLVVSKYILEKNQYNTRTKIGLPKTPISNPSAETINATLNDKKTPYYFYLHDKKGGVHYAVDNNGHVRNRYKYLR